MSEPKATLQIPAWLGGTVITLLTLQLGMLWLQGSLLHRQHGDLQGLREDVQYLSDSLDQNQTAQDDADEPGPKPARTRKRRAPRQPQAARVRFIQDTDSEADREKAARKDLEDVRKSEREAVAKARDVQEKLSISENIRKADEKARLEAEGQRWRPWLWLAGGVAVVAMFLRSWLRRRG
jgi:cell wall-associated NlpC family hydrolase